MQIVHATFQPQLRRNSLAGILVLISLALALAPLKWAVVATSGAILMLVILLQPALGIIGLVLLIPFGQVIPFSVAGVGLADALIVLILASWLARGLAARNITVDRTPLLWPMAVFLWFGALSLIHALSWKQGALEWLKWAEFGAAYLVAAKTLRRHHVRWLLIGLFTAAIFEVALGAFQFWRQAGPEAFGLLGRFVRAYGTLQQPNPYAGYLGYLLPIAVSLAIGTLASWRKSGKTGFLLIGLILSLVSLLILAGIAMSWSRGSWIGAAVAILVVVACRSRRTMLASGTIILLLCIILLLGASGLPREGSERMVALTSYVMGPDPTATEITDQNFSVLERLAHWRAGMYMLDSSPWIGVGIGNYAVAYPRFSLPHWYDPLGHAHNLYINFLAETGVLGVTSFLVLWTSMAVFTYRQGRTQDVLQRSLALGLLGTVAYLTMHNLFDNLFVQHLQLQLALLLGAVVALRNTSLRPT